MMEWVEVVGPDGAKWEELRGEEGTFAEAWECCGDGYWVLGDEMFGEPAPSIDDAKDAAWAAVYRSTR